MGLLATAFGARIRALRTAKGLTQIGLGEAAGISEEWVRRIERGEGEPSFDTIEALAKALGVAPVALFEAGAASPALEQLLAQARQMDSAELDWLLGLVGQIQARPKRRRRVS